MDIFPLTDEDGRLFGPVRQASIFAKYSRSPESARELVKKTSDTAAEKFQEKWIVGFGHNSIAELATIPVAFEDVSIIASKCIERWQRPGVCEKSTRMQEFHRDSLLIPKGLDPTFLQKVTPIIDRCFDLYERVLVELPPCLAKAKPELDAGQARKATFDVARHLLPAGCRTNLGICAYPRDLAEMVATMSGSPNPEFEEIGNRLKEATLGIGGPLIRHTEPDEWAQNFELGYGLVLRAVPNLAKTEHRRNFVKLMSASPDELAFWDLVQSAYRMNPREFSQLMERRPAHHKVPDLFRLFRLFYSVCMDYGAFRDLQRHRRMDQYVEPLTPFYGFVTPSELEDTDLAHDYEELLQLFVDLAEDWPKEGLQLELAQYLLPLAFRVGWHIGLDLEQLFYLVELRTRPQGHISYRRVSYQMLQEADQVFPSVTQWVRAEDPDKS